MDDVYWACGSDIDCTVASSSCKNGTCQCPTGYVYNGKMTSCIKVATGYGEACEESIQCSRFLFNGGACINSTCVCVEGYYYMHGRCNAYSGLSGKCHKDVDCHVTGDFEAVSCVNGICKCSSGYYQREYRSCRPIAKGVGDKCFINNDCKFNSTAYCSYDYVCTLPEESLRMSKSLTKDNTPEHTYTYQMGINQTCTENVDCEKFDAFCDASGNCACKRAHFFVEEVGKCIPEIGEPCQQSDSAVIEYSECRNGKWHCEIQRVVSEDNRICLKAIADYKFSCLSTMQCYVFGPDAICKDGFCVCNENSRYNESESFCWGNRGIGEKCQQDIDCYVNDNSTELSCTENVCSCPNGTDPNSDKTACVESSPGLGKRCEINNCGTKNAECANGICTCKANYFELDNECAPGINATCDGNADCKREYTECVANICVCQGEYVGAVDLCLPVSLFGQPCSEDIQCRVHTINSVCLSNNNSTEDLVCRCPDGYHYKSGGCFKRKVLGMNCDSILECYLDADDNRAVCKNSVCSCDWNYVQVNQTICGNKGNSSASVSTWLLSLLLLLVGYVFKS
ncbi:uncharacterized protein LOC105663483 isoform X2 [Megachile rotundata]